MLKQEMLDALEPFAREIEERAQLLRSWILGTSPQPSVGWLAENLYEIHNAATKMNDCFGDWILQGLETPDLPVFGPVPEAE